MEINDIAKPDGYDAADQNEFKTTILKLSLCDYNDSYMLVKGTITITRHGDDDAVKRTFERNKDVIFRNDATFNKSLSEINNTQRGNAKGIYFVILMYNLIE